VSAGILKWGSVVTVLVTGCLTLLEDILYRSRVAYMAFSFILFLHVLLVLLSLYIWLYVLYAFV
jgi:hypothetical protein